MGCAEKYLQDRNNKTCQTRIKQEVTKNERVREKIKQKFGEKVKNLALFRRLEFQIGGPELRTSYYV